jgi:hydroxyacylglutathione hydrolase
MVVKRFYDEKLAQASYLIGSAGTGAAIVIDPNRDVEQYVRAAAAEGLTITHVTETHIHADFVSGSRELASRTGATLYLSDEGDADWKYAFAAEAGAVLLKDRGTFNVGEVRIDVVHTPGHTPEHLMFVIADVAVTPVAAVTGDFLFVGDVGRPDLLERAAGVAGSMEGAARALFRSLRRLKPYPDYLQIWPGHSAGSACGKGIGSLPQSTLGYERRVNWAFGLDDEDDFVHRVLAGQPEPPRYFAEMKRVNKEGPRVLGGFPRPERLSLERFDGLIARGAVVIDTRPAGDFAAAHVPGMLNIPLNRAFTTWAGWLAPYREDFYLIIDDRCTHCLDEAVRDLAMIGLDRIAGYAGTEILEQWVSSGRALGRVSQIDPGSLAQKLSTGTVVLVDVRSRAEWDAGHIAGADHIPLGYLPERLASLAKSRPVVVQCQRGARSAIAASLLRAHGFPQVINLAGGFAEWQAAGQPVDQEVKVAAPESIEGPWLGTSTS